MLFALLVHSNCPFLAPQLESLADISQNHVLLILTIYWLFLNCCAVQLSMIYINNNHSKILNSVRPNYFIAYVQNLTTEHDFVQFDVEQHIMVYTLLHWLLLYYELVVLSVHKLQVITIINFSFAQNIQIFNSSHK
jgi:hypothetical protein